MKVLVVGSGAREHALVWKIKQSSRVKKILAAPGNPGIGELAECRPVSANNVRGLLELAEKEGVDLTVVGPEAPLVEGIVDEFDRKGLMIFGPHRSAARLEGSKVFAKELMKDCGVPTAQFKVFDDSKKARDYLQGRAMPCVIKADGLAAGKGVTVARTLEEAEAVIHRFMEQGVLGEAGTRVVIEDFLQGEELSVLAFTDGERVLPLASSQDHKRAFDHDEGPNTGGMGAYSPCPFADGMEVDFLAKKTIEPIVRGLAKKGIVYRGLIYAGLMITEEGPYVLEFNVRFGDPEAQAVLPRLKNDLARIFVEVAEGQLKIEHLKWDPRSCISVVIASGGYPGNFKTGFPVSGLDLFKGRDDLLIFHAGTVKDEKKGLLTSGGRVLNVVAWAETLERAREKAYEAVREIHFEGRFYRTDIGERAVRGFSVAAKRRV